MKHSYLAMALVLVAAPTAAQTGAAAKSSTDLIANARRAAPASIADRATYVDWEGNVLQRGTNGYTCYPDMPGTQNTPMCLDAPWVTWLNALMAKQPVRINRAGIGYMLMGDAGASNTDPFATGPTATNNWVVSGPHLMLIASDARQLEGMPTDPNHGGPWVMWKGTAYAHVMIPLDPKR